MLRSRPVLVSWSLRGSDLQLEPVLGTGGFVLLLAALLGAFRPAGVKAEASATVALTTPVPLVARKFVLALDPGHGGDQPGCRGGETSGDPIFEKDVALGLALELELAVRDRVPDAEVVLTRRGDESLSLLERVELANRAGADLFISVHANASPTHEQQGFETYVLDAALSEREAARMAWEMAGSDLPQRAIFELELVHQRARAMVFARLLQEAQVQRFPRRADRGVKQAGFDVLMGARMPAVLFEAAFLDNAVDRAAILDPEARAEVIDGMVEAIVSYYRVLMQETRASELGPGNGTFTVHR